MFRNKEIKIIQSNSIWASRLSGITSVSCFITNSPQHEFEWIKMVLAAKSNSIATREVLLVSLLQISYEKNMIASQR